MQAISKLAEVTDKSGEIYKIVSMEDELNVSVEEMPKANVEDANAKGKGKAKASAKAAEPQVKDVPRVALLREWKLYKAPEKQVFIPGQYPNPCEQPELKAIMYKGFAIASMIQLLSLIHISEPTRPY